MSLTRMLEDEDRDPGGHGLRFAIGRKLHAMPYGMSIQIDDRQIQRAFPPTGEHAPATLENVFRALALAHGGNRPETSYTTEERITNDLDGSFTFRRNEFEGYWLFHRKSECCPQCCGRKQRIKHEPISASFRDFDVAECEPIRLEPCDCKPERRSR